MDDYGGDHVDDYGGDQGGDYVSDYDADYGANVDYEAPADYEAADLTPQATPDEVPENADLAGATSECPGGDLETCIDVCPGFNKVAFGLCVAECGQRCP